MGSGQGARLCVWRSRQGLTDTDWTSQLGTLSGLKRDRGSPGADCRRSIQRGACRGGPSARDGCSTPTLRSIPRSVSACLVRKGRVRDGCDWRPCSPCACAGRGSRAPAGGPESRPRAVRGTLVPPEGATWGGCWRATDFDDVPRVQLQDQGAEFEALAAGPGAPDAVCGARGAAGLRPLRIGLAGAATG